MTSLTADTRREQLFAILRANVARTLPDEALRPEVSLSRDGLGLDSITIAEVVLECETHFGVSLLDVVTGDDLTVGDLAEALGIELSLNR
jgi:acyl carrier protein